MGNIYSQSSGLSCGRVLQCLGRVRSFNHARAHACQDGFC
ncbi:hypothetical protein BRADI_3g37935v3 [Brachypodium distachyon]|uniref:Uncharacterized protein n=1 Tax=Brachypodium distachyon TaxID=15368 RepID=A0A2K2D1U0_BRADI|nr:hypothetical protein BRADI_3g37935v3 [Brachypodium distachyon]